MSRLHQHLWTLCQQLPQDYVPYGALDPEQDNGPRPDCSCGCKYYLTLEGRVGYDWGVCANPESHRAGLLTFEHQGCRKFALLKPSSDDLDDEMEGEP